MALRPGLLVVHSRPKPDSTLTLARYHDWYNAHLRSIISASYPGAPATALRYRRHTASDSAAHHHPYITLYPLRDLSFATSDAFKAASPQSGDAANIDFEARVYEEIHRFVPGAGERLDGAKRGVGVSMVGLTPGDPAELDEWYRKQHLDMFTTVQGYLRTTRYRHVPELTEQVLPPAEGAASVPHYLAVHEFEAARVPPEHIKLVVTTEWSKAIDAAAKKVEREMMELVHEEVSGDREFATLHS